MIPKVHIVYYDNCFRKYGDFCDPHYIYVKHLKHFLKTFLDCFVWFMIANNLYTMDEYPKLTWKESYNMHGK